LECNARGMCSRCDTAAGFELCGHSGYGQCTYGVILAADYTYVRPADKQGNGAGSVTTRNTSEILTWFAGSNRAWAASDKFHYGATIIMPTY
jgi:hypothetical protein